MGQLHLYVPQELEAKLRDQARAEGISLSKLLARLVASKSNNAWPKGYFSDVVGQWKGPKLTRGDQGNFEKRARL